MTTQKLEDVIAFTETQLRTLTKLDVVVYQGEDDQDPKVRDYGAVIYIQQDDFFESEHRHIGPSLTEFWTINVDVIIQRKPPTPRETVSASFGTSYWFSQLTALFLNKTNGGAFVRTSYSKESIEEVNSGIKLKGKIMIEILNRYT